MWSAPTGRNLESSPFSLDSILCRAGGGSIIDLVETVCEATAGLAIAEPDQRSLVAIGAVR